MAVIINPTQMGQRELALVKQFIENNIDNHTNDFFSKDLVHEVYFPGEEPKQIQFTHNLFRRKSAKGGPDRYEVEPNENDSNANVGQGTMGVVNELLGTLSPDKITGAIRFKSREEKNKSLDAFGRPKNRVVKKVVIHPIVMAPAKQLYPTLNDIKDEVEASKKVSYLGTKNEAICHHNGMTTARIVFRMLQGRELFFTLCDLMTYKIQLTVEQRITLTLSLLKTLKNEIHDNGFVHRDIKPENIIFYATQDYSVVRTDIIDLGMALPIGKQDYKSCGSPHYAAPEVVSKKPLSYPQSDLFSMSKLIGFVWGAQQPNFKQPPADKNEDEASRILRVEREMGNIMYVQNNYQFDYLFTGVSGLSKDHQNKIYAVLMKAHNKNPFCRPSIPVMMDVFQEIQNERRSPSISPSSCSLRLTPQSSVSTASDNGVVSMTVNASPVMDELTMEEEIIDSLLSLRYGLEHDFVHCVDRESVTINGVSPINFIGERP